MKKIWIYLLLLLLLVACEGVEVEIPSADELKQQAAAAATRMSEPVNIGGEGGSNTAASPATRDPEAGTVGDWLDETAAGRSEFWQGVTGVVNTGTSTIGALAKAYGPRVVVDGEELSLAEALKYLPELTGQSAGSIPLPDPGPSISEVVSYVTSKSQAAGIPPEIVLSALWSRAGYLWDWSAWQPCDNPQEPTCGWIGTRHNAPDGSVLKSPGECLGLSQLCPGYLEQVGLTTSSSWEQHVDVIVVIFAQMKQVDSRSWREILNLYTGEDQILISYIEGIMAAPPVDPETGQTAWPASTLSLDS